MTTGILFFDFDLDIENQLFRVLSLLHVLLLLPPIILFVLKCLFVP
jgi:hypothetical protein